LVSELAPPTGTTQAYLDAYRTPTDANTKLTEFLSSQRLKGVYPEAVAEGIGPGTARDYAS
jgi:hypothetical protein